MPEISPDEVILQFTELVGPFLVVPLPETHLILDALLEFYRQTRVRGAALDADGDMFLLEWGSYQPPMIDAVTDLRRLRRGELRWDPTRYRSIHFVRQVNPAADDDGNLDDFGFCLGVYLHFQPDNEQPIPSNMWIDTPLDIPGKIADFSTRDYVAPLISSTPSRIAAYIDGAG